MWILNRRTNREVPSSFYFFLILAHDRFSLSGRTTAAVFIVNGTHSSTLAWKIPWTEEPGRLQSMGLRRVRHD